MDAVYLRTYGDLLKYEDGRYLTVGLSPYLRRPRVKTVAEKSITRFISVPTETSLNITNCF
ncbi:conserved hypothetical protein [Xenorhabdus nematophila str. Websteri]|nr:conserved hypothetical protein [Xenorhabdus nematophila str. Websteri]CEF32986.1 conserved hypothetical protein [Xenorhabdus nematophila str. Websteri]